MACGLFYFVHLNEDGAPIPSTMYAKKSNNKIDKGYKCFEARLPNIQMVPPAGTTACINNKSHFRYFYKVNNLTGEILANSLWQQIGKPRQMCSGQYSTLEYIVSTPR